MTNNSFVELVYTILHRLHQIWSAFVTLLANLFNINVSDVNSINLTGTVIHFHEICMEDDNIHNNEKLSVKVIRKLAEGGFSYVYEVASITKPLSLSQLFAMKRVLCSDDETVRKCRHEIGIHRSFQHHPNFLSILAYKFEKLKLLDSNKNNNASSSAITVCYMLFPLISLSLREELDTRLMLNHNNHNDSIRDIYSCRPFTDREILEIFAGVIDAAKELHHNGLAHRDIKVENILLHKDQFNMTKIQPILMDFGSVAPANVPIRSRRSLMNLVDEASENSTVSYRAPELFEGHIRYGPDETDLDARVDVWSLGCVLFAMIYGYSPFECEIRGDNVKVVECSYLRVLGLIPKPRSGSALSEICSKDLHDLVIWILNQDRLERPTIEELSSKVETMLEAVGVIRPKVETRSAVTMGKTCNDIEEGSFFQ